MFFQSYLRYFLLLGTFAFGNSHIKVIAFVQDNLANDFRKAQVFEAQAQAKKYPNIHFVYTDAQAKTSLFIYQIEQFIKQKVDLLIIGTHHADSLVRVLDKAHKKGIPMIILDRGINTNNYHSFIHSDNFSIGKTAGEFLAKQLQGKGKILLFEGLQNTDVSQLRTQGFLSIMKQYPQIKIEVRIGNFLRKDSIKEMEKVIMDKLPFDAVFAHSDSMISGIRSAMQRYHQDPKDTLMIGCDYIKEAQDAISHDKQTASIKQLLGGKKAIDVAVKILNNENVPKDILLPIELVTKENIFQVKPIF